MILMMTVCQWNGIRCTRAIGACWAATANRQRLQVAFSFRSVIGPAAFAQIRWKVPILFFAFLRLV
jgi:hypothetical protein